MFLDLLRTTDMLSRSLVGILKAEDLSANQYNVLRILRGAHDALPCGEIASRMITRDPDITRLLDRLQKQKLVRRKRDAKDRRVIHTMISAEGLRLLKEMDPLVNDGVKQILKHMSREKLTTLVALLEEARQALPVEG